MIDVPQEETAYTSQDNRQYAFRQVIQKLTNPLRNAFPDDPDFADYAIDYWHTILAGEPRIRIPRLVSHLTCLAQMREWQEMGCGVAEMRRHMEAHIERCLVSHTPPDNGETYIRNVIRAGKSKQTPKANTTPVPGSIPEQTYQHPEPSPELAAWWKEQLTNLTARYLTRKQNAYQTPQQKVALLSEVVPLGYDDTSLRIGCPNDRTAEFVREYYLNDLANVTGKTVLIETGAGCR